MSLITFDTIHPDIVDWFTDIVEHAVETGRLSLDAVALDHGFDETILDEMHLDVDAAAEMLLMDEIVSYHDANCQTICDCDQMYVEGEYPIWMYVPGETDWTFAAV